MTHLFLFTISPVQSFIAQARKTQDLWAGSRMLSAFVEKVFDKIDKEKGKVIFPYKISDSMPNRILASFHFTKTDEELKKLGEKISKAVVDELEVLRQKAEYKIGATEYAKIKNDFEKQLKDYFSTFWVFVPYTKETYAEAYDKADRLLGAVKNSRTFTQNPEQGRKCSLSGEQNALMFQHADSGEDEKDKNENREKKLKELERKFVNVCALVDDDSFGDGEGLSAISYLKRIYQGSSGFPSTAKVALMKDLSIFSDEMLNKYEKLLGKNFDEQLYYEENLTPKYFEKHKLPLRNLDEAKKQLSNLGWIAKQNKRSFTKYYAILLFDADSMGAWLSGEYLNDRKNKLQAFHTHISGLLSNFAEYAKKYVDGELTEEDKKKNPELKTEDLKIKKGRTVYAGGDDYLGFVNLHYLFDVIKHLREEFKKQVSDKISDGGKYQIKENKEMTFSAGISIAHYKTPLSEVLTWARKMEKEAKDTDNKDSFGMAVLKKSGEIHKAVLPFKKDNDWVVSDLDLIVKSLSDGISPKFMSVLEREMLELGLESISDDDQASGIMTRLVSSEIKRLIERAGKEASNQTKDDLKKTIDNLLIVNDTNYPNLNKSLSVCDFINRKLQGND